VAFGQKRIGSIEIRESITQTHSFKNAFMCSCQRVCKKVKVKWH